MELEIEINGYCTVIPTLLDNVIKDFKKLNEDSIFI
jgi:hypothetical protein